MMGRRPAQLTQERAGETSVTGSGSVCALGLFSGRSVLCGFCSHSCLAVTLKARPGACSFQSCPTGLVLMAALSQGVQPPTGFHGTRCALRNHRCALAGGVSCGFHCVFTWLCFPFPPGRVSSGPSSAPGFLLRLQDYSSSRWRWPRRRGLGRCPRAALQCQAHIVSVLCFAGVADENAFLEECRQRGQHALPSQAASTSTSARPLRSHKPASLPRHASPPYVCEDEDEQGRHRAAGSWDPSVFSAGVQRGTEVGRPHGDASLTSQGQRGQKMPLCCCVLT